MTRTLDSVSFNAWFTAFVAGNAKDERLAAAGCAPVTVPRSTPGWRPTRHTIPTLRRAGVHAAVPHTPASRLEGYDTQADAAFTKGSDAGSTADNYIRDTVFLATVLFLIGISGHFRIRQARLGLIGVGGLLLIFAVIQLLGLPDAAVAPSPMPRPLTAGA